MRRILLFVLATLALPALFLPAARPQEPPADPVLPGRADQAGDPKQLADQVGKELARARAAVEQKRWDEAADAVLKLLELPPGTLAAARGKGDFKETSHWFSPHALAGALVAALPAEGLAAYRKRADAAAADLLKQARDKKDAQLLAAVLYRFPHTPAAGAALKLVPPLK